MEATNPKTINIKDLISLRMRTLNENLCKKDFDTKNDKIVLPLVVTVESQEVEDEDFRQGLDLVIVVDISGSMKGEKIKLVKETLDFVLDELDDRDRICILTFNSRVEQICGFKSLTNENKTKLKELVKTKLKPKGCTNLRKAMNSAFNSMLSRDEANDSTAVFLISDGQDTCGNNIEHIRKAMDDKDKKMREKKFSYQVHSFGYGEDYDEQVLSLISKGSNGNFYYIKTLSFIDECFVDCFGYLMSSFGKDVEVEVHLGAGVAFENIYSSAWDKKTDRVAVVRIPGIAVGKTLDYTAEISINTSKHDYSKGGIVKIGRVDMSFRAQERTFMFDSDLKVTMVPLEKDKGENDVEVEEHYVKFEAVKVMEEAKKKMDKGNKKECEIMVNDFLKRVDNRSAISMGFKKKMRTNLDQRNFVSSKAFTQVRDVFNDDCWAPEFEHFNSMNCKQKGMMERKKKRKY